jgi:hypothetical protein
MSHALLLAVCSVTTLAASNRVADEAAIRQRFAICTEARRVSFPLRVLVDLVKHEGAWLIGAARIARTQAP